jgi:hypothetical protein
MTEQADQLHNDNAPAHSAALVLAFLAKHHITQVCQRPYSPELAPCDLRLFPKLKSPLNGRRFVNATITQYTSSVNGISLPTDWPHGRVTVHGWTVRSPLFGCQVTSRPRDRFSRYSKWLDTFRRAVVYSKWLDTFRRAVVYSKWLDTFRRAVECSKWLDTFRRPVVYSKEEHLKSHNLIRILHVR